MSALIFTTDTDEPLRVVESVEEAAEKLREGAEALNSFALVEFDHVDRDRGTAYINPFNVTVVLAP